MDYESLLENLHHPNAQIRQTTVLILGMVDEVRAIVPMQKRYARESNRNVKQAIQTVGGQLAKTKREGYETLTALCEYFHVYDEAQRIPAQPPGNEDLAPLIDLLTNPLETEIRCRILQKFAESMNPGALAILADTFWLDEDPQVQAAAKEQGKILYWNLLYWHLEHDGTLNKLIQEKADEPGIILPDQE